MSNKNIYKELQENIPAILAQDTPLGDSLWKVLIELHPADIAEFLGDIDREDALALFKKLPKEIKFESFIELSDPMKAQAIEQMDDHEVIEAFNNLTTDELTDLFDYFSDEALKKYLNLLHKRVRDKVLSLMQFEPESAGGIMTTDVISLMQDFTVEKSINILQRISPSREIHPVIYVINHEHQLVGHINLEDLVLQKPNTRIQTFMRKNELIAHAEEDRETIAKEMVHYGVMTIPVVDDENHFLGIIPGETLVDIIVEEASEDAQKMSALAPLKYPYFETSIFRLFYERGYILVALLIAESFSGTILRAYEAALTAILVSFIPMLISAGGNTSSQTSAVVIQGMATGEISSLNMMRFLRRELMIAAMLATILGITAFIRVYVTSHQLMESFVVSLALGLTVLLSGTLGSCIPFILRRLNIDPAFSAGPFLATIMDILGILIFCIVSKLILL